MASQYDLQLKAILDSTQVKQELEKLRQLQNQIVNKGTSSTVQGGNNFKNFDSLNSTLGKLNLSIAKLNQNIQNLATAQTKANLTKANLTRNATVQPRHLLGGDLPDAGFAKSGDTLVQGHIQQEKNKQERYRQMYLDRLKIARQSGASDEVLNNLRHRIYFNEEKIKNYQKLQDSLKNGNNKISPELTQMITMGVGGFLVGDILAGLNQYFQRTGNKTGQTLTMYGTHIGQGVAMGAPLGVKGMGYGLAFGLVQGSLQKLAENVEEASNAIQNWKDKMSTYGQMSDSYQKFKSQEKGDNEIERLLATGNKIGLEWLLKKTNSDYDSTRKYLDTIDVNELTKRGLQIQEDSTTILGIRNRSEDEMSEQIEIDNQLYLFEHSMKRMNELVVERLKIQQALKSLEDKEAKKLEDKLNQEKQLNDNKTNVKTQRLSLQRFDEILNNDKIRSNSDYDILKDKANSYKKRSEGARRTYEWYLNEAENADTVESSSNYLKQADKWKEIWQFTSSEFSKFNSAITQIEANKNNDLLTSLQDAMSRLTAPSMDNVNSLASQGLMINRADDASREKSAIDYQREQTELQKQIKTILDEKSFKSVIA